MDLITTPAVVGQSPPENSIVHSTSVSLTSRSPSEPVHLVQYDTTMPFVAVALTSNGQPYTVPSGAAVNVRLKKPDGHYVYDPAYGVSSDGQTVYIAITVQMTVVAGKISPIVEVVLDGAVAGTGFFVLDIDPNPIPEDAIESTDEYQTIQQLAAQVTQAAQVITDNMEGIQYVQQNSAALTAVAQNAGDISAVGGSIDNVNTVAGNLTPIQTAATNIAAIQQAPAAATNAGASATLAESWAVGGTGTRSGEDTNNAKYYALQAQSVAQGQLGWYATPQDLQSAHPTGQNGQWAIIGTTDTIWTWDSDTSAWVDTGAQVDLSNYYTKTQADQAFATAAQGALADSSVQTVNGISPTGGAVVVPTGAELLWKNSNPSQAFSAQTVSVPNLHSYNYILIAFSGTGSTKVGAVVLDVSNQQAITCLLPGAVCITGRNATSKPASNEIEFSSGYYYPTYGQASYSSSDSYAIPCEIFGLC